LPPQDFDKGIFLTQLTQRLTTTNDNRGRQKQEKKKKKRKKKKKIMQRMPVYEITTRVKFGGFFFQRNLQTNYG